MQINEYYSFASSAQQQLRLRRPPIRATTMRSALKIASRPFSSRAPGTAAAFHLISASSISSLSLFQTAESK